MIDIVNRLKNHKVLSISGDPGYEFNNSVHISGNLTISGNYPIGGGDTGSYFIGSLYETSEAQGDIIIRNGTGWTRLGIGTSGNYLKSAGTGENPEWASVTAEADTSGLVPYLGAISGVDLGAENLSTTGSISAGSFIGSFTGDLEGNVNGNVTGNLTGSVVGEVEGNLTGSVLGDVTGNITGSLLGDITGDISGLNVESKSGTFARIDMQGSQIYNLGSPTDNQHAATKQYVDGIIAGSGGLWQISGNATELISPDEVNMQFYKIINLDGPSQGQDAANKFYVDTAITTNELWESGTEIYIKNATPIDMQNYKIINVSGPENDGDAANKKYVDDNIGGIGSYFIGSLWDSSEAQGDLITHDSAGWTRLAVGGIGSVLASSGAGNNLFWKEDKSSVGGATKEFFTPFLIGDSTQLYSNSVSNFARMRLSSVDNAFVNIMIPNDFSSIEDAVVVMIPDATETIQFDLSANIATSGESYTTHEVSLANETLDVSSGLITEANISGLFTDANANDYVGINFQSDTTYLYLMGVRIKYT